MAEVALRNPRADVESRKAFEEIVDEAAKASVLLDDMLTLARADAEPIGLKMAPVDLTTIIDGINDLALPIATERNITLHVSNDAPSAAVVMGDFSSLRRLIWILLDNSLKYTQPNGRIDIFLRRVETDILIEVSDTGIGISQEDLPHIFNRFYRADPSRSIVEGNGLGLSIARWIAEQHHAKLLVDSKVFTGTTFSITIAAANVG